MAMGNNISPGVYTRIIDLSEYLQDIPGTVGFLPILSKKGPDNKLQFISSKEQFMNMYGEPNILNYGKYFGQGPYVANQHLGVSSHMYVLRAMPDDATYSHLIIGMQMSQDDIEYENSSSAGTIEHEKFEMHPFYLDGQEHTYRQWDDEKNAYIQNTIKYPSINHVRELETFLRQEITYDYMWTDHRAGEVQDSDGEVIETVDGDYSDGTGGIGVDNGFLMYFRSLGRGSKYNDYAIRISRHTNSQLFGVYILDIFETQDDGDQMIIESFNVSFDQYMVDDSGESLFIEDVVNKYSQDIRCKVNRQALRALNEYKDDYYKNDPTLPEDVAEQYTVVDEYGEQTDLGYKALRIELASLDYDYSKELLKEALDQLAEARNMPTEDADDIVARNAAISEAISEVSIARTNLSEDKRKLEDAYSMDIMDLGDADEETAMIDPWGLDQGTEGSLVYTDQLTGKTKVSEEIAKQTLTEAYLGLLEKSDNLPRFDDEDSAEIDGVNPLSVANFSWKKEYVDEVFDLDWVYFSLVYDAGYHPDVKEAAKTLADTYRRDCMLISDVGDNLDYDDVEVAVGGNPSIPSGRNWNSRYAARFDPYSKVYDSFTGRDIWISPVYHMAETIPLNDRLYEIWYASAGFNRGSLSNIKELRWSPKLGERDKLYLMQVNPIVHFPQGYTVWGNLTTQKKPTSLQDINVMRLVLYIKRALEQYCKFFVFEFNDKITHDQIKSGIIPFLSRIQARRGLVDFSVDVGATEYEFKNKICHVNVTLEPMKVIEKIELNLFVK